MKLKARIFTSLLLFLLFASPCFSRVRIHAKNNMDPGIYVIDYRGPETHTYIPPPNRAGDRASIHRQTSMARHRSKNSKAQRNGKQNHG